MGEQLTSQQADQIAQFLFGLIAAIIIIGLVTSMLVERWRDRRRSPVRSSSLSLPVFHAPVGGAPKSAPAPAAPMEYQSFSDGVPVRSWLDRVNLQPDKTPHLAVTGPSGSGKTTLVLAVLADRAGRLVVCTPKAARTDPWGGFPAVRLKPDDMSYAPLGAAIRAVYREMLRRNAQEADTAADWLTLIVDDFSTVIGELPELKPLILRLLTLGRSVRIRLIIIDTETNVKAWGIEGRGEARNNLIYVECEEDTHVAKIFRWKERDKPQELDTSTIKALSDRAQLGDRAWSVPQRQEASMDEIAA